MSAHADGFPLAARAATQASRIAVSAPEGTYRYADLLAASARVAARLLAGTDDLRGERVAFLVPPGFHHVAVQWGVWRAGGVAVPLAVSHPAAELAYVVEDSAASVAIATPDLAGKLGPIAAPRGLRFLQTSELLDADAGTPALPVLAPNRDALILYTSGTTSRPKGVVITHGNIQAQVATLVEAWQWQAADHTLLVLPLHHVHGIINVLTCALWSGACVTIHPQFDAQAVWEVIAGGALTVFMAVPTIYSRLIAAWHACEPARQVELSAGCHALRLMVSGSAALPVSLLEEWQSISGQVLLERYGMTEIGMALSNPLHGERRAGSVGVPLPGVDVRLVDEQGQEVAAGTPGEIEVRGPSVFREYWHRPEATSAAFRAGWFRTGDIAEVEDGYFRILGRNSVDIIKTGGYKVSALEIEEVLRGHSAVREAAVVGLPDAEWGQRVGAALVLSQGQQFTLAALRAWAGERLAPYKIPTRLLLLDELPRNSMGKVTKPSIAALFPEVDQSLER